VNLPVATYIGRGAFSGCTSLASVSLPAATDIGGEAFYGCARLGSADLPVAASIGDYAFSDCANLAFMNLPASLAAIDGNPFAGCTNLASIIVDSANTVFSARGGVLLDKAGITLIAYPSAAGDIMLPSLIAVGGEAFQNCTSLRSVSLPAAADIGRAAFCDCANLRSVNLPAAASIGRAVFYGCTRLGSVSLPAAASIDGAAFRDCESLESVSLSAAADIGDEAFYGCTSLRSVSLPLTPPSIGYNIFSATGSTGAIVASVPVGAVSAYISAWGVSASTPTGGNESVYGSDSKAVYITDASWRSASIDSFQGNALRSAALSPLWEIYQF
jgi:hypothetical protein